MKPFDSFTVGARIEQTPMTRVMLNTADPITPLTPMSSYEKGTYLNLVVTQDGT